MPDGVIIPRVLHTLVGGLEVSFGPVALEPGERLVLFGPNGAGKTTALRLLAGTVGATLNLPAAAYMPQRPYMFRGSARHNLHLGLSGDEVGRSERLAQDLLVGDKLDSRAQQLSGGERQRLALARALASHGDLVLLDEPLSAVDARNRDVVVSVVGKAVGERAAVIVTHDRDVVAALAHRVAVMVDGVIRQLGPVADVFSLPVDDDVAVAVGLGNVLSGVVVEADPPLVEVDVAGIRVWSVGGQAPGTSVKVLFGAETVTVSAELQAPSSARNVWTGRLDAVRPMGRLVELVVNAGPNIVALITPGSLDALDLREGGSVVLSLKATAARAVSVPDS
jgi:molybdate transport system ATP-binding protein